MRRLLLLACLSLTILLGCGGSAGGGAFQPPTQQVTLSVNPSSATLSPGATQAFVATVTGTANTAVSWSVVEAAGGSVNTAGLYTAPGIAGTYHVQSTSVADTGRSAQATVTVTAPPPVIAVTVDPASANLRPGATQAFTAVVTGTANPAVAWSVAEAGGGTVNGAGLYTAPGTAGTYHVKATSVADASKSNQATVTVTAPPPVIAVAVNPPSASLQAGATHAFTAVVTGTANLAVAWSVVEAGGGAVDGAGLYTAPGTAGTYHVKATSVADASKSDQATVTVTAPPPVIAVTVNPPSASLQAGATQPFTATVTGTANPMVAWSVLESGGGTVNGAGLYTAPGTAGIYHVKATSVADPSKGAQATVTVTVPPPVVAVAVNPPSASLQPGASQAFTASVTGTANAAVAWSVVEVGGGSVDAQGLYTAPDSEGAFHVKATSLADPSKSGEATVMVTAPPPVIAVTVNPASVDLQGGAAQAFTATVTGTANTYVSWSVVEAGGGSVTAAGLYTAPGGTGTYHVRATSAADASKSGQATVSVTAPPPSTACNGASLGAGADLNGYRAFPDSNAWNQDISAAPVDPSSASIIAFIGAGSGLHADFGAGLYLGQPIGIPYVVVDGQQGRVPIVYTAYGDESDPGPMPIPATAPVEGGSAATGDRHVLVMDRDACVLHELYRAFPQPDGSWKADSGAVWDLKSDALRPFGWTSADAAGLPIFPGLARYDEAARGEITHALRFTVPTTRRAYVLPATHWASSNTSASAPPMGMRVRLKAGVDISGYPAQAQVVLRALKKFGMILADNGSAWFISGAPDDRWDNDQLARLSAIKGSDLEVVQMGTVYTSDPIGAAPAISAFSATPAALSPGGSATLSWTATHATRSFISPEIGWVAGSSVTVRPAATTTYTLTAEGPYGSATAMVTVTVGGGTTVIPPGDPGASDLRAEVRTQEERKPISPWIYGINFYGSVAGAPNHLTLNRMGGNRWTAYNWENNASNSGTDWGPYSNDGYLGGGSTPGEAVRATIAADQARGMASLMTIQLQGYAAADKTGLVNTSDPNFLASRFRKVVYRKPTAFAATPDTSDAIVYMDEFLAFLRGRFASDPFAAGAALPTFISLDNEPELWDSTHHDIQPVRPTPDEYIQKTVDLGKAIKDVAPGAVTFGPAHYGFNGIYNWQNAAGFTPSFWFTDKYLRDLKTASDAYGKRLVDAYDLHWYSEAQGDGQRVVNLSGVSLTDNQVQAIVQSPRSLWDTTYTEASWIAQYITAGPIYLLPRLQAKIDANWPGTRIAITEYGNGGDNHIAGAIAQADNLGIFGRYEVFAANLWPLNACPFILAGYKAFRDYDGTGGSFGDTSVRAVNSDWAKGSVWASVEAGRDDRVVLVLCNKAKTAQNLGLQLFHTRRLQTAEVYELSGAATAPVRRPDLVLGLVNALRIPLPALSVTTLVLRP